MSQQSPATPPTLTSLPFVAARWVATFHMRSSYSFYLLHSLVIGWWMRFFHDSRGNLRHQSWSAYLLVVCTIAAISIVTYKLIKQPLRRRLRPKQVVPQASGVMIRTSAVLPQVDE